MHINIIILSKGELSSIAPKLPSFEFLVLDKEKCIKLLREDKNLDAPLMECLYSYDKLVLWIYRNIIISI